MNTDTRILRLLQLCSAALPVGAYAFSQGLEYAIDQQWINDKNAVKQWLSLCLLHTLAKTDVPILQRLIQAKQHEEKEALFYWNNYLLACRETNELRLTDTAMGKALKRLLSELGLGDEFSSIDELSFATGFSIASVNWNIDSETAVQGYIWCWLENQVSAATKLLPMGQTAAQQLLFELASEIPAAIMTAQQITDEHIGSSMPGLAMASAWHETQYSRLYRS